MVVFGNKVDKESDRQVTKEEAQQWCVDNNNIPHFETSATEKTNVEDAFTCMIKKALSREKRTKAPTAGPLVGGAAGQKRLRLGKDDEKAKPQSKSACEC